jgi:transposase
MTSTNTEETLILKTDALGRVRMPADRREAILDAFEQSGMSGLAFAKHVGVKYPTLASWIQKRRRERDKYPQKKLPGSPPSQITFVEAQIEKPSEAALQTALEVQTAHGVKLRIRSQGQVAWAAELIRFLNKPGAC